VLDLTLPGVSGFDLIENIRDDPELQPLPIIVYTGKELSREERTELEKFTEAVIIKDVKSPERLLDETALFLHRVEADLPPSKRQMLHRLHESDPALEGKKVLIVDDDVRNIFAMDSILEPHKMQVLNAENGRECIEALEGTPDIDVILMDIMMPEMDGYEAMNRIRKMARFKTLPIIALTAKAMKGDRERCIEAGASDYITKPIDANQLVSLLRVWLAV
jgi:CheY-like chemotaxis protein